MARTFNNNSANYLSLSSALIPAAPFSIAFWVKNSGAQGNDTYVAVEASDTSAIRCQVSDFLGSNYFVGHYRDTSGGTSITNFTAISSGVWRLFTFRVTSGKTGYVGINNSITSGNLSARSPTNLNQTLVGVDESGNPPACDMAWLAMWNAYISVEDVAALVARAHPSVIMPGALKEIWEFTGASSGNEVGLLGNVLTEAGTVTTAESPAVARSSPIWPVVTPAAGAATDITVTAGALTLTGASANVALEFNRAPTAATLTLTGANVTVALEFNRAPTAATLTLTGASANVAQGILSEPTAATLTLTGASAAVSLEFNRVPTAATLTLTGASADVFQGADIQPTAGTLTLTGANATVALEFNRAPTAGTLTLTGTGANVALELNRAPTAGTLTFTGASAEVTQGLLRDPTAGTLTLTGASATVALELNYAPTAGTLTFTGASVDVTQGGLFLPAAGTLTLTGVSATVAFKFNVAPTAAALTLSGSTVTVEGAAVEPEPEPTGDGAGAGEARGAFPGRRRREEASTPVSSARRNVGPTFDELEAPAEADVPGPEDQTPDDRLAQLATLREELRSDEGRVVALEGQLEAVENEILQLEQRKLNNTVLLLLMME